jgi:hypothetical protein
MMNIGLLRWRKSSAIDSLAMQALIRDNFQEMFADNEKTKSNGIIQAYIALLIHACSRCASLPKPRMCGRSRKQGRSLPFDDQAKGRNDLRDRFRPFGPAAHWYIRGSSTHNNGAPCLSRAHRQQGENAWQ